MVRFLTAFCRRIAHTQMMLMTAKIIKKKRNQRTGLSGKAILTKEEDAGFRK